MIKLVIVARACFLVCSYIPYSGLSFAWSPWWLQGKRGECAVKMGHDGCEDEDEQGTVYIVPMTGREKELILKSA